MKKCCVLIPYYNSGNALLRSLESIDRVDTLDVLVVDDGSERIPAADVLRDQQTELRIDLIRLPKNRGIEYALNAGLELVRRSHEYIARLDCGDRSINDRIRKQIKFLDQHPSCGLVGGWVEYVSPSGEHQFTMRHPTERKKIRRQMYVNNAFTHSSVMFRSSVLDEVGLYPVDKPAAEDFAFFMKIASRYDVANIPEPLAQYVVDPQSLSSTRRTRQIRSRIAVLVENFQPNVFAIYGLVKAVLQLPTPRRLTIWLNRVRDLRR